MKGNKYLQQFQKIINIYLSHQNMYAMYEFGE